MRVADDAGSRMQKMWFQVTGSDGSLKILAVVSVCPVALGCKGEGHYQCRGEGHSNATSLSRLLCLRIVHSN